MSDGPEGIGSHSELVNMSGAYSHLISMQATQDSGKECETHQDEPEDQLDSQTKLDYHLSTAESSNEYYSLESLGPSLVLNIKEIEAKELQSAAKVRKNNEVPLHRLIYLNKPELPMLILGSISAAIRSSILPVFGALFSVIMKIFYKPPNQLREDARFWMWMFIVLGCVGWIGHTGQSFFFGIAGSRLIRRIRSMLFEKVVHMEMRWFDDAQNSSSMIGTRLSLDAAAIRSMVGETLALVAMNSSSVIIGLSIAFQANWQLSLIVVALVPLLSFNALAILIRSDVCY